MAAELAPEATVALPGSSNVKVVKRGLECSVFLGEKVKNAPDVTLTSFSPNGLYHEC